jgi:hypothetical protein
VNSLIGKIEKKALGPFEYWMITTTTTSSDKNSNAVSIGSGMMKRQSPQ